MSNTQNELLAGVRWALAQAMRQWASYANEKRHEPDDVDLGAADQLEDDTYNRALEIMERLGAAAGEQELIAACAEDRVRLQRVVGLAARWLAEAAEIRTAAEKVRRFGQRQTAEKAEAGALVYETCASTLKTALGIKAAGSEPNAKLADEIRREGATDAR